MAVMLSRVLGLVRDQIFNALFGGDAHRMWLECYQIAFRIPNMLRDLFAEGALSTAFVAVFTKKGQSEGDVSAWELARKMATLTAIFMTGVSVLGILLAPWITRMLAPGFSEEMKVFTTQLAQIMYPFILLVSLAALVMGMLNSKREFAAPALSSCYFNVVSVIIGVVLGWWIDPSFGKNALIGFAIGVVFGGVAQLASQLPTLHRVAFRFRPDTGWKYDEGVRNIMRLMWPAVIAGSVVQVNVFFNSVFASYGTVGSVNWLQTAFRLMQLPLGVFGVTVATITLPALARESVNGINDKFRQILGGGLRLVFVLTLPCAVGLFLLSEPVISVLFQHGRFDGKDVAQSAGALKYYAIGLVFYSAIKVLQPAFYTIDKRFFPMIVGIIAVIVNVALNSLFVFAFKWGHTSLALSTAIVSALNFGLLYWFMRRQTGSLDGENFLRCIVKLAVASLGMAVMIAALRMEMMDGWVSFSFMRRLLTLGFIIADGGLVFYLFCMLMKLRELQEVTDSFLRKIRRRKNF